MKDGHAKSTTGMLVHLFVEIWRRHKNKFMGRWSSQEDALKGIFVLDPPHTNDTTVVIIRDPDAVTLALIEVIIIRHVLSIDLQERNQ